jgi:hypothetical protein
MIRFGIEFNQTGLKTEIAMTIPVIVDVANKFHKDVVLTSGTDRKHGRASLHYVGLGLDITWAMFNREDAQHFARQLAMQLGHKYDVVLEDDHIHLEYQPK